MDVTSGVIIQPVEPGEKTDQIAVTKDLSSSQENPRVGSTNGQEKSAVKCDSVDLKVNGNQTEKSSARGEDDLSENPSEVASAANGPTLSKREQKRALKRKVYLCDKYR